MPVHSASCDSRPIPPATLNPRFAQQPLRPFSLLPRKPLHPIATPPPQSPPTPPTPTPPPHPPLLLQVISALLDDLPAALADANLTKAQLDQASNNRPAQLPIR
jgi:hypothetical protein